MLYPDMFICTGSICPFCARLGAEDVILPVMRRFQKKVCMCRIWYQHARLPTNQI